MAAMTAQYSINMDIFNYSLPRLDASTSQIGAHGDPLSATSASSFSSWASNSNSNSTASASASSSYESTVAQFPYAAGYDRPWLFSPPSGFRKGLKKTDLRPIDAPTKPRSQLPKAANAKRVSPYARPEAPSAPGKRASTGSADASAKGSPSPEQLAKLEKRRRANAEAQRLSRQRKEETLQALREEVELLNERFSALDADLDRLRREKAEAERVLSEEMARAAHLQLEIARRASLKRRVVERNFMQMQAEQGMTPMIGLTTFPNSFWV